MARIPYVDLAADAETSRIAEEIRRRRNGFLPNLYHALLAAPPVCEAWLGLGSAIRFETELSDDARELTICHLARLTDNVYEWTHHRPLALAAGVSEEQLAALPDLDAPALRDHPLRSLLAVAGQLALGTRVADEDFDAIVEQLGRRGYVELAALCAYYVCLGRFMQAVDLELEPGLGP